MTLSTLLVLVFGSIEEVAAQLPRGGGSWGLECPAGDKFISDKYHSLGGDGGFLGLIQSGGGPTPDGIGCFRQYDGGSIYWSPQTGAREVHGAIRDKWASVGWERSLLGYPTTDEIPTPDGGGRYNRFEGGWIYWSPQTGAHEVHGWIGGYWVNFLGAERSLLGYPITDERAAPDGIGRYNDFRNGSIYYLSPETGAHEVHGAIRDKWLSLWTSGKNLLGYPTTDESPTPDGIGRHNNFQNGSIYWTLQAGANVVPTPLPLGLTGGIAYVNHLCDPSIRAVGALVGSLVGLAACGTSAGFACFGAILGAAGGITAAAGTSFLSCGVANVLVSGRVSGLGPSEPVPTLMLKPDGSQFTWQAADGWVNLSDGDKGNNQNYGFYHQELKSYGGGTKDLTVSDKFRLPRGTACGFHHTQNTPPQLVAGERTSTCMGNDPASDGCPNGWAVKSHFDMSSDNGYFTWCEYQDPHGLCDTDPQCLVRARANGYAVGISSNTDATGVESGGSLHNAPCPSPGYVRTSFFDDGRDRDKGLSWCMPIPDEPQGLTAYLQYLGDIQELRPPPQLGFVWGRDGDVESCPVCGFYHWKLDYGSVTDLSRSASFKLLPGTACGFHHTLGSPGMTCMGLDPATGNCPAGWVVRSQFDMGSGDGGAVCGNLNSAGVHCHYWVWCEYQDPNGLCSGPNLTQCEMEARYDIGYTTSISSNVEDSGKAGFDCPAGFPRSPYFDAGRDNGTRGLSWCKPH
jgi:hypothetical protein